MRTCRNCGTAWDEGQYGCDDYLPDCPRCEPPVTDAGLSWQPIETAPKDGTEIFIFRHNWLEAPVAQWIENHAEDGSFFGWGFDEWYTHGVEDGFLGWNEDIEDDCMPTHWMPIPNLPEPV
jgi:hypothetical protein